MSMVAVFVALCILAAVVFPAGAVVAMVGSFLMGAGFGMTVGGD